MSYHMTIEVSDDLRDALAQYKSVRIKERLPWGQSAIADFLMRAGLASVGRPVSGVSPAPAGALPTSTPPTKSKRVKIDGRWVTLQPWEVQLMGEDKRHSTRARSSIKSR